MVIDLLALADKNFLTGLLANDLQQFIAAQLPMIPCGLAGRGEPPGGTHCPQHLSEHLDLDRLVSNRWFAAHTDADSWRLVDPGTSSSDLESARNLST